MNMIEREIIDRRDQWNEKASIRCKPRRKLPQEHSVVNIFPISRQPTSIHPIVFDRGEDVHQAILVQTVYRYMYEIAILELEVVNNVALKIATNKYPFTFSFKERSDAMAVLVDEAYHAYVSFDFIQQVQEATKLVPLTFPQETAVSRSLQKYAGDHFELLELVSVCLSEHVLTKDLVNLKHEIDTHQFFIEVMQDHLSDEGRHAVFFADILTAIWQQMDIQQKIIVAEYLPRFMSEYINNEVNQQYDRLILESLEFSAAEINTILNDTYFVQDKNYDSNVKNFLAVLKKTTVLTDVNVQQQLLNNGFIYLD